MKALTSKMLMSAIAIIASVFVFSQATARAQYMSQLEEKTLAVSDFSAIHVSGDFEVTLSQGPCGAKVTADKVLFPYVQAYVRAKVLYISFDSKAVPKDIRKLYKRGRNAVKPVFRAIVYLPELSGITLEDNASVMAGDRFDGHQVEISLGDKSQIKNLDVHAGSITVSAKKNAQAAFTLDAVNQVDLRADNNANIKASVKAHDLLVNASAQTEVAVTGEAENSTLTTQGSTKVTAAVKGVKAVVQMGGSSDINLSGEGEQLSIRGERSANLEAGAYTAKTVDAGMSGSSKANVTVEEQLDATLVGGSALYYTGAPVFKIGKVIKSTLAPYGATSK